VSVPLIAMVRPRPGGFCYSSTDFDVMIRDARSLLDAGADGLAFGILQSNGEIDERRCGRLREICSERVAVFHRAFDVTPDPLAAMASQINLRFNRLMTSGQEANAVDGIPLIAELIQRAAGRIEVLPAGGIRRDNVAEVISRTGCHQVHASMRSTLRDTSVRARPQVRFRSSDVLAEALFDQTDRALVADMRSAINQ
jgi:copper homeostasis protein